MSGNVSVQEFRRVENISYTGRQIKLLSPILARELVDDILSCAKRVAAERQHVGDKFWIILAMTVDKMLSMRQNREPLIETINQRFARHTNTARDSVAWNMIHACAQIQATLYSFRVLHQILLTLFNAGLCDTLPAATQLRALLSTVIPVERYPRTDGLIQIARELQQGGFAQELDDFVTQICFSGFPTHERRNFKGSEEPESVTSVKKELGERRDKNNIFSVLGLEG
jgi:hypothetical protein